MARLHISDAALEAKVLEFPQVQRRVDEIAREVELEARELTHARAHDTGALADALTTVRAGVGRIVRMTAGPGQPRQLPEWVNRGTGIYGPRRQPIRPKKQGGFLVFRVKDQEEPVFARQVRGLPATHIMRDAGVAVAARFGVRWRSSNT